MIVTFHHLDTNILTEHKNFPFMEVFLIESCNEKEIDEQLKFLRKAVTSSGVFFPIE